MSIEYKWSVNKVTVDKNNLIVKVELVVTGSENDNTASMSYIRNLFRGDTFIPYEKLTEQQVLDWCFAPEITSWTDLDNVDKSIVRIIKDEGETQVAGQIARQLEQAAAEPALPWVTA